MQRIKRISLLAAFASLFAVSSSQATPIIVGGQVYAIGNSVTVDIVSASAQYVSDVGLYAPFFQNIGNNTYAIGDNIPVSGLNVGDELVFGINVIDTGDTFQMGPGSRNADLLQHASVTWLSPTSAEIGFEDIYGGGDMDYNDVIIRVDGVSEGRGTPAPEPATLAIWGLMAGGGLYLRRKSKKA